MTLANLNNLSLKQLRHEFGKYCGSSNWIQQMTQFLPFENIKQLMHQSQESWAACSEIDWLEAFSHHPRIGEKEIEEKFSSTANLANREQSGVKIASKKVISELAELNDKYFNKFGFIFIIFATGKCAEEMLTELQSRIKNDREKEMKIAAAEQIKITQLRLEKMLG